MPRKKQHGPEDGPQKESAGKPDLDNLIEQLMERFDSMEEDFETGWEMVAYPLYDKLLGYVGEADYPKVLALSQAMETIQQELDLTTIPMEELAFRQAGALAIFGRLDEALSLVEKWKARNPLMYYQRVSSVYSNARDFVRALECKKKALQLAPKDGSCMVDCADALAYPFGDVAEARRQLDAARKAILPELGESFVLKVEGLLALLEGRYAEAVEYLGQARKQAEADLENDGPRMLTGHIRLIRAFRAVALAGLGKTEEARQEYEELKSFLSRDHEETLCAWIEGALAGNPQLPQGM